MLAKGGTWGGGGRGQAGRGGGWPQHVRRARVWAGAAGVAGVGWAWRAPASAAVAESLDHDIGSFFWRLLPVWVVSAMSSTWGGGGGGARRSRWVGGRGAAMRGPGQVRRALRAWVGVARTKSRGVCGFSCRHLVRRHAAALRGCEAAH